MHYRQAIVLGLIALMLGALPVQAVNVKKSAVIRQLTTDHMVKALSDQGASDLEETTDDQGDPMVNAEYDGLSFAVLFYNCEGSGCEWGQFRASFERSDLSHDAKLKIINEWNLDWVFGKAYVNEDGDMILEQPFVVEGGVTQANLTNNAEEWLIAMKRYAKELGWE